MLCSVCLLHKGTEHYVHKVSKIPTIETSIVCILWHMYMSKDLNHISFYGKTMVFLFTLMKRCDSEHEIPRVRLSFTLKASIFSYLCSHSSQWRSDLQSY